MHPLSTIPLALAMSADAFAAALGKGAGLHRPHWREALRIGLIFGGIEGTTPLAGWLLGRAASSYIAAIDHWLAFVLLAGVGAKMIHDSLGRAPDAEKPERHGFLILALTAVGTSIDALAIGVTLALIGAPILFNAAAIGIATFTMSTIGVIMGHRLGTRLGKHAEIAGGLILILIGATILFEHLSGQMG
jgi:putative Mn2+ efflux pump MntP